VAGFCGNGNEPSGAIKGCKFFDYVSDYQLLRANAAVWSYLQFFRECISITFVVSCRSWRRRRRWEDNIKIDFTENGV